jgi:hypothetical protein
MVEHPAINLKIKLNEFSDEQENNRNNLRKLVIDEFIKERAGQGNKEKTSKYKYYVEELSSGNRVYLTRPVPLNKGFDFIIHVENHKFLNKKDNPRHDDIGDDLRLKKTKNPQAYKKLLLAMQEVFECRDPDDIYHKYQKELGVANWGLSSELILKVVKWFFIEQDIRYWNWSGRNMFMQGITDI